MCDFMSTHITSLPHTFNTLHRKTFLTWTMYRGIKSNIHMHTYTRFLEAQNLIYITILQYTKLLHITYIHTCIDVYTQTHTAAHSHMHPVSSSVFFPTVSNNLTPD